ncbi:MAG: DUF2330 domain-containing protein [Bacteroidia bacterium]
MLSVLALAVAFNGYAFCGFYVAKADAKLFNKTSQVIIVRDGEKSTITMSSDFEGDVKDFAMVVPVPVVLEKNNIRVVDRLLFDKLDAYSSPRLVEYYDQDPCYVERYYDYNIPVAAKSSSAEKEDAGMMRQEQKKYNVTIEAKYNVGEYDILILSAKESGGLEAWLNDNGYKIPEGAKEVLDPYIKSNMKFFVVKVNMDQFKQNGAVALRPLQINFNSPKFMLPIRLGMANANGAQDMIVYAFSKQGRIETTNYRTVPVPTDQNVPLFVKNEFGEFYKDLYNKAWKREGKNVVFLEYAWDVSLNQGVKCDPCVGPPPMFAEFREAGVDWITTNQWGMMDGNVYFTRLHVTYERSTFPQDLMFQETPNQQRFQGRYVLTNPANGSFDCENGQQYLLELNKRRWNEMWTYQWLTGRDLKNHLDYPNEYNVYLKDKNKKQGSIVPPSDFNPGGGNTPGSNFAVYLMTLMTFALIVFTMTRRRVVA